jgi:hypothetical protein
MDRKKESGIANFMLSYKGLATGLILTTASIYMLRDMSLDRYPEIDRANNIETYVNTVYPYSSIEYKLANIEAFSDSLHFLKELKESDEYILSVKNYEHNSKLNRIKFFGSAGALSLGITLLISVGGYFTAKIINKK